MQCSPSSSQLPQRSNSPVFFTGCTTSPPKSSSPPRDVPTTRSISAEDFENLKRIVSSSDIFKAPAINPSLLLNPAAVVVPAVVVPPVAPAVAEHPLPNLEFTKIPPNVYFAQQGQMKMVPPLHPLNFPHSNVNNVKQIQSELNIAVEPLPHHHHHNPTDAPFDGLSNNRKRKRSSVSRPEKILRRPFTQPGSRNIWDQLTQDIWKLYHENKQTPEIYEMKMNLRDQLHHMLLSTFPNCGLYVVGSSMTGLGTSSSDMDMCLMLSHSEIDQELEATNLLHRAYETFRDYDFLVNVELIPAKVPILRFKDFKTEIEVDLNINNSVGIRNTQLLTSYSRIDERVSPLILLAKLWARCHGINDAKNHTLSSYSLVLMVIHYLQYGCSPPVLPCLQRLQPDKYQVHSDVRSLKLREELPLFKSDNVEPLAELFLGFLDYFCNRFDFASNVMTVRLGGVIPKFISMNNMQSPKNKRGHWKLLCIEEPFNFTNTACSVFNDTAFYYIKDVFLRSWNMLRSSGNLKSILNLEKMK